MNAAVGLGLDQSLDGRPVIHSYGAPRIVNTVEQRRESVSPMYQVHFIILSRSELQ